MKFLLLLVFTGCGEIYLNPPDLGASVGDGEVNSDAGRSTPTNGASPDSAVLPEVGPDAGALSPPDSFTEKPPRPAECYTGVLGVSVPNPCAEWCTTSADGVETCP